MIKSVGEGFAQGATNPGLTKGRTEYESQETIHPYAIKPDIVTGHKNKKVGLFVLGREECDEQGEANGAVKFRYSPALIIGSASTRPWTKDCDALRCRWLTW